MKVSLSWLKEYVPLDESIESIEEALTLIGFEVEGIEGRGLAALDKVVVGEVLSTEPHPDADRLSVCQVRVGPEREPTQIVCGASNFKVGDRVPVALPGARLPGDFKIKKSKLRGVVSKGMMCSARELELGGDASGLLILPNAPEPGTPIHEALPEPEVVFDIEVTPNRPDCLCHLGIARELAAWFGLQLNYPVVEFRAGESTERQGNTLLRGLGVDDPAACPYYTAASIQGVRIGPSPGWLVRRLETVGLRPVNNVVDVTNYVMLELGQPLHAFDLAKIGEHRLSVRRAKEGEKIRTLDEKERPLDPGILVIADAQRPLAIAGVMGSADAEVDETTRDLVLEAAFFDPLSVRRTSRKLGLASDSSYRFERGVDAGNLLYAAERAISLILEVAGGELSSPLWRIGSPPLTRTEIAISGDFVRSRCGFGPDDEEIRGVFESLEMQVSGESGGDSWTVQVPSFRSDLTRPIDLVEEFLRIYGTDKIPARSVVSPTLPGEDSQRARVLDEAADLLVGAGFRETLAYSLREEKEVKNWFGRSAVAELALDNPLASDQSHLRSSLLPGLLDALAYNAARNPGDFRFFETGRVFREVDGSIHEAFSVAFVIMERQAEPRWKRREGVDFYTAKGLVERILSASRLSGVAAEGDFQAFETSPIWLDGHGAWFGDLNRDGFQAEAGAFDLSILRDWSLSDPVIAGEALFSPEFLDRPRGEPAFAPFSAYPPSTRDLALVVSGKTSAGQVRSVLEDLSRKVCGEVCHLEDVVLFDVYQGKGLKEGEKSLAFNLRFRRQDRTLNDKEVSTIFERIQEEVASKTAFSVRT